MIALLVARNGLRHPLRSALTAAGIAVALMAYCLIQTLLDAWYQGVAQSAKDRLITRNRISLIFPLPISYKPRIEKVPGVGKVGIASWFGGIYKDERIPFAQFGIDSNYLDVYPELLLSAQERAAFDRNRKGALIGENLAQLTGLKPGDIVQLRSEIYPGQWEFKVEGILRGRDESIVTREMYFHWEYFNERNRLELKMEPDHTGVFISQLTPGADAAAVSQAIDALFANSYAETLTESETSFVRGFLSMASTIIMALDVISYVVIVILLLVMANTMLISARERMHEFAVLKSIGFRRPQLLALVLGESLAIGLSGFALLCVLLLPVFTVLADGIKRNAATILPTFAFNPMNLITAFALMLLVAVLAGVTPALEVARLKVNDGLRRLN